LILIAPLLNSDVEFTSVFPDTSIVLVANRDEMVSNNGMWFFCVHETT